MSVRIEKPLEAPGHKIKLESAMPDIKRGPRYWVSCSCGWRTSPEGVNIHHTGLAREHLAPYVAHDLEVVTSGPNVTGMVFCRSACTCGWESDSWHPRGYDMTRRWLKTEHASHCWQVKRMVEEVEA